MSGKELFNYNSSLFVDDDAAIDASEEIELNAENKRVQEEEDRRAAAEVERAQAEQYRLLEAQRLEEEENKRQDEERKILAAAADRIQFRLGDVFINQIVFDISEKEDLELFVECEDDATDQN